MTDIIDVLESGEVIDFGPSLIGVRQHPLATGIPSSDEVCPRPRG